MQVNSIQPNTNIPSQQSFKAKMDPVLVKGYKDSLMDAIANAKTQKEASDLLTVAKKFAQFLKDIKTENNTSTITHKYLHDMDNVDFYQVGAGGVQLKLNALAVGCSPFWEGNVDYFLKHASADKIKSNEAELEKLAKEKDAIFKHLEPENE